MTPHPPPRSPDEFDVEIETDPIVDDPTAVDSLAGATLKYRASHARRVVVVSAAVALCFTAILVWSLGDVPEPPAAPTAMPVAAEPSAPPVAVRTTPAARPLRLAQPRRLAPLMELALTELRADGSWTSTRMGEVLREGVAVVNLWATYCEPCMRELTVFRAVARAADGRDARFVFVMSDAFDPRSAAQARALTELREVASGTRLLVDPADDIGGVLRATGVHAAPTQLPLTLVLRCGEVAWGQLGEIQEADLQDALNSQRRLGRCERAARPTAAAAVPDAAGARTIGCGDGLCDRLAGETCASCRDDCGCAAGRCIRNAVGDVYCARDESALKE